MVKEYYKLHASVISDVGKVRQNNEDNFYFFDNMNEEMKNKIGMACEASTKAPIVFGVFDGMGGHEQGEKASWMTAEITKNYTFEEDRLEDNLEDIIYKANEAVCEEMRACKTRIGTTASFVALHGLEAYICNIGDTPIYLYRNHELMELHEEHTEKRMYERLYGKADPNKKYRLTQNIGVFEEEMMIKPFSDTLTLLENDIVMICSDGLTDMVSTKRIIEILETFDLDQRRTVLKEEALNNGGRDNITIILLQITKKKRKSIFER